MKLATGIVRRVDELGRVVIPKELRKQLNIEERDPIEITCDGCRVRSGCSLNRSRTTVFVQCDDLIAIRIGITAGGTAAVTAGCAC